MIVSTIATTPSVNAFSRLGLIASPWRLVAWLTRNGLGVVVNCRLRPNPFDQLVELDRLLGRGQCVTGRKSVLTGGLSSDAGGSGKAGHWCVSASTGIGCGF